MLERGGEQAVADAASSVGTTSSPITGVKMKMTDAIVAGGEPHQDHEEEHSNNFNTRRRKGKDKDKEVCAHGALRWDDGAGEVGDDGDDDVMLPPNQPDPLSSCVFTGLDTIGCVNDMLSKQQLTCTRSDVEKT